MISVNWFEKLLNEFSIEERNDWFNLFGKRLFQGQQNNLSNTSINILSIFSGAGGLDIGFEDAGYTVVEKVEINPLYVKTLHSNNGAKTKITCQDIREYKPVGSIDFIIGGPPCQTFSMAGKMAGLTDSRGTLFKEYVRLIEALSPKGFLFENVPGVLGVKNGDTWKEILTAFSSIGYQLSFRILDAADYGVPQHRERVFIIGLKEGEFFFPSPSHGLDSVDQRAYYGAGKALTGVSMPIQKSGLTGKFGHLLNDIPCGLNYSFYTEKLGHPNPVFEWRSRFSDFLYKADPELPVRTLKAQGGQYTGPFSWENRPFAVEELKRLQTFPDEYQIVGGRGVSIEQIGNSVPPQISRILALSILEQVFQRKLPFNIEYMPTGFKQNFNSRKRLATSKYFEAAKKANMGTVSEMGLMAYIPDK